MPADRELPKVVWSGLLNPDKVRCTDEVACTGKARR